MIQLKTNKTTKLPDHRVTLTAEEVRNYVMPRFKYLMQGKTFKKVRWTGKGVELYYKTFADGVKVAIMEPGGGYPETFYSINDLEELLLPF